MTREPVAPERRGPDRGVTYAAWGGVAIALYALYEHDLVWGDLGLAAAVVFVWARARWGGRPWEERDGEPGGLRATRSDWVLLARTSAAGCSLAAGSVLIGGLALGYLLVRGPHAMLPSALGLVVFVATPFIVFYALVAYARGVVGMRKRTRGSALVLEPHRFGIHRGHRIQWWVLSEIETLRTGAGSAPQPYREVLVWDRDDRRGRWTLTDLSESDVRGVCDAVLSDLVPRLVERLRRGERVAIGRTWPGALIILVLLVAYIVGGFVAYSRGARFPGFSMLVAAVALVIVPSRAGRGWVVPGGAYVTRRGIRSMRGGPELAWEDVLAVHVDRRAIALIGEARTVRVGAGVENAHTLPGIAAAMRDSKSTTLA